MSKNSENAGKWRPSRVMVTFTNAETGERETEELQGECMTRGKIQDHPALRKYYGSQLNHPAELDSVEPWPPESLLGIGKRMSLPLRTKYLFEWKFGLMARPDKGSPTGGAA
jgi:hypothetical protein